MKKQKVKLHKELKNRKYKNFKKIIKKKVAFLDRSFK